MNIHAGGCLCGDIRFEARGPARAVFHCHCYSCRRHTGAAVATFAAYPVSTGFRWTKGPPASYPSSPGVTRTFCPRCGTPLSYQAEKFVDEIHLNIGTIDDARDLIPAAHWHTAEQIPWLEIADHCPRHTGD